ncbi:MAG: hypothetical protein HY999_06130 [Nitrospinae bacterium]|nr:hypothetical protein [Nitrospinota bacterium]
MTNLKKAKFTVMLTPTDRYRHRHVRLRGNVLSFVVQYETILEGKWLPIVRYDTGHGFAHRDLFDGKGNKSKTPMFTEDYNKALTFAEYDIKSNWRIYKKAFTGGAEYEEDDKR